MVSSQSAVPIEPSLYRQAKKLIDGSRRILIIPHANVDPDGLSSALACYHVFGASGKECTVLCPDTLPESLTFLPGFEELQNTLEAAQEFIITLDCSRGIEVDKLRYAVEENKIGRASCRERVYVLV